MRSSTGKYYPKLDHVRALAAFLVFTWHFSHVNDIHIYGTSGSDDLFFYSFLLEGHTGVSLFMVLSGYIFAKLTGEREIRYGPFLFTRALRLAPLLMLVIALAAIESVIFFGEAHAKAEVAGWRWGWLLPVLPNGGWSITVELHFYILFPFIMVLFRRDPRLLLALVAAMIALRLVVGVDQMTTYQTIIGRIDQFLLGMLLAWVGSRLPYPAASATSAALLLLGWYYYFDHSGGFYENTLPASAWSVFWSFEALLYAVMICWYDKFACVPDNRFTRVIATIGVSSYSIYLLHYFFVFRAGRFIERHIMPIDNFYVMMFFNMITFVIISVMAWLSYLYFERFWLKWRMVYYSREAPAAPRLAPGARRSVVPSD